MYSAQGSAGFILGSRAVGAKVWSIERWGGLRVEGPGDGALGGRDRVGGAWTGIGLGPIGVWVGARGVVPRVGAGLPRDTEMKGVRWPCVGGHVHPGLRVWV